MKKRLLLALVLLPVLLLFVACGGNDVVNNYNLSITVQGNGTVTPANASYQKNSIAYITVQPDAGWYFNRWEGINRYEVSGQQNNWQIVMSGNKDLVAVFSQQGDPGDPDAYYNINVTVQGRGEVSPNSGSFKNGEVINFTLRPDNGWIFSRWTGSNAQEIVEVSGSYHLLMDGHKSLTAVFEQNGHVLDIDIVGKGKVEQKLMGEEYGHGSIVRLWAKPDNGWTFKEWKGDIQEKSEIASIEMISDMFVQAIFERAVERYELTIKKIGQGTVKESLFSEEYKDGDLVELKATPASGWVFVEWRGDEKGKKPTLLVEMDSDKTITAVFEEDIDYYYLDVDVEGNGRVTKSPDAEKYEEGEQVTLKAVADSGWEFKEWRGDVSGSNPQIQVTMNNDKQIIAVFTEETRTYWLSLSVNGSGTVTKDPDQKEYKAGTVVTLTAQPNSNSYFIGWAGDASGSDTTIKVTMDSNKNITAGFTQAPSGYKISAKAGNQGGNPYKEPDKATYEHGEDVEVWGGSNAGYMVSYFLANDTKYEGYEGARIEGIEKDWEIVFYYTVGST